MKFLKRRHFEIIFTKVLMSVFNGKVCLHFTQVKNVRSLIIFVYFAIKGSLKSSKACRLSITGILYEGMLYIGLLEEMLLSHVRKKCNPT